MKRYKILRSMLVGMLSLSVLCGCTRNVGTTQDNASANIPEEGFSSNFLESPE